MRKSQSYKILKQLKPLEDGMENKIYTITNGYTVYVMYNIFFTSI